MVDYFFDRSTESLQLTEVETYKMKMSLRSCTTGHTQISLYAAQIDPIFFHLNSEESITEIRSFGKFLQMRLLI